MVIFMGVSCLARILGSGFGAGVYVCYGCAVLERYDSPWFGHDGSGVCWARYTELADLTYHIVFTDDGWNNIHL